MCSLTDLVSWGTNLAGISVGTSSAKLQGQYGKLSAEIDESVANFNADLLHRSADVQREGADTAIAQGELSERKLRTQVNQTLGTEVAAFAAAGVDPNSGSPLVAQAYTASQGELDAGIIRARALRTRADTLVTAASTDVQATNYEYQAIASRLKGQYAQQSSQLGVASAIISGVSKWPGLIKSSVSNAVSLGNTLGSS